MGWGEKRPEMLPKPNVGYTGHTYMRSTCVCRRMGQAKARQQQQAATVGTFCTGCLTSESVPAQVRIPVCFPGVCWLKAEDFHFPSFVSVCFATPISLIRIGAARRDGMNIAPGEGLEVVPVLVV